MEICHLGVWCGSKRQLYGKYMNLDIGTTYKEHNWIELSIILLSLLGRLYKCTLVMLPETSLTNMVL